MGLNIGVLALQGAFREHRKALDRCGAAVTEVRLPSKLEEVDGLIIPGGESTTINNLIKKYSFRKPLDEFYVANKPIFGTCAGMIMLAKKIIGEEFGLGYINIEVQRNAYGRQIESFEKEIEINLNSASEPKKFNAIFIRAPKVLKAGPGVEVLSKMGRNIVLAREKNILVCAFHPELGADLSVHNYFVDMVKNSKGGT